MKYDVVIFDMDGTILDTLDDLAGSLNTALEQNGLPRRTRGEVRRFVGNGIRKLVERGVPAGTNLPTIDKVHADFTENYRVHCADMTRPYDGITDLIRMLKRNGTRAAVVSNKADYAVQALCARYFDGLFDLTVGEREGIRKKPAPDAIDQILKTLGCDSGRAVYVGDSEVDIETARNADVPCISVDWGFRDRASLVKSGANIIVSNTKELQAQL
jgi:haloacid dehalogenase superfamily, subfamily IA, variant 3 with third motif having DD or ED/haloacid dehalogenase superfamily, subfamily IA, variant 1 with third motif having Dx(3-4)D or Dx(3-4)E